MRPSVKDLKFSLSSYFSTLYNVSQKHAPYNHPLGSTQIPQPNLAAPQPWQACLQFGEIVSFFAFCHSLSRKALDTPQSRKSQGRISSRGRSLWE